MYNTYSTVRKLIEFHLMSDAVLKRRWSLVFMAVRETEKCVWRVLATANNFDLGLFAPIWCNGKHNTTYLTSFHKQTKTYLPMFDLSWIAFFSRNCNLPFVQHKSPRSLSITLQRSENSISAWKLSNKNLFNTYWSCHLRNFSDFSFLPRAVSSSKC